jgi:glycerol-3-phosphate acyltransferase PlsY
VPFALACLLAYLLGAIPFALLLVRLAKGIDVRKVGSGNVGATNASRAFQGPARLAVFLLIYALDFAKGFLPALYGPELADRPPASAAVWLGACAVVGHCASPFLKLRGGKGVATTTGVVAAIEPLALLVGLAAFAAVLVWTKRVFLGSLALGVAVALAIPLREPATAFGARGAATAFGAAVAALFVYTHRSNLRGLLAQRAATPSAQSK